MPIIKISGMLLIALCLVGCASNAATIQIVTPLPEQPATQTIPTRPSLRDLSAITTIEFSYMYDGVDEDGVQIISDDLQALAGTEVRIAGYIAPPLTLHTEWFALTRQMVFACPFCTTADSWTPDVLIVYADEWTYDSKNPVMVVGTLEVGEAIDEETGMLSLVRIREATVTIIR